MPTPEEPPDEAAPGEPASGADPSATDSGQGPVDPAAVRRAFLLSTATFYGGGFLATWLTAWLIGRAPLEYLPGPADSADTWMEAGVWAGIGLVLGLVIVAAGHVASRVFSSLADLEREFATYLFWMKPWRDAFVLATASALAEEAFFRGLVQPLLGLVASPWVALLGSSLVFAICHPPLNRRLRLWPLFAFAMGLLMGWLFDRSGGNLLAPTVVHFVVNFLNLRMISRRAAELGPDDLPFPLLDRPPDWT